MAVTDCANSVTRAPDHNFRNGRRARFGLYRTTNPVNANLTAWSMGSLCILIDSPTLIAIGPPTQSALAICTVKPQPVLGSSGSHSFQA